MKIACDVDGVVADLMGSGWLYLFNRDHGTNIKLSDITQWNIHEIPGIVEHGKEIYDYLHRADLYDYVEPIDGALEGVRRLRDLGHRVIFTTTNVKGMTDPKWNWLEEHGFLPKGRHNQDDLVVAADKLLVDAQLLIDDRPETIGRWVDDKRRRALIFQQPWNIHEFKERHSAFWLWCQFADGWQDVVSKVNSIYHEEQPL